MMARPLPAQRLATPPPSSGMWHGHYPNLVSPYDRPFAGCPLHAPGFARPENYLVCASSRGAWPPPPRHLAHTIEWLRRLTPLPHRPLVAIYRGQYESLPLEDLSGAGHPLDLADHLLFLLETSDGP